jgi:type II secretory pathway pseudopilin PulG
MISTAIVALLALFVVADLRSSSQQEQLITATRLIAADLRAAQARAFAAQNLKTCDSSGKKILCELGATSCDVPSSCGPYPPLSVGIKFASSSSTYTFFGDVDTSNKDWMDTPGAGEEWQTRDLGVDGAPNVIIDSISSPSAVLVAQVAFERQNGNAHINPCAMAPCTESGQLVITLRQLQTGRTKSVTIDAASGRVSVE